jgi:hypothetical protein
MDEFAGQLFGPSRISGMRPSMHGLRDYPRITRTNANVLRLESGRAFLRSSCHLLIHANSRISPIGVALSWLVGRMRVAWQESQCGNRSFPGRFEGGLVPGTSLLWPGLAQNRAASRAFPGRGPSATRPSSCVGPTPPETRQTLRQKLPVDALRQVSEHEGAMNESEKRFSFTRAASSTSGRPKSKFLSVP